MTAVLTGDRTEVEEGGLRVVAPGLMGTVEARRPEEERTTRSAGDGSRLDLGAHGFEVTNVLMLDAAVAAPVPPGLGGTREAAVAGDPVVVVVAAPDPGPGWGQALLAEDTETGVLTWAFADLALQESAARGVAGTRTYAVRMTPSAPPAEDRGRGFVGAIVKKIIRVVAFKIAHVVIGDVATYFTRRWEEKNRPCALWAVGNTAAALTPATAADWPRTRKRRVLLLLHGTASNTANGFHRLPPPTVAALRKRYAGGIFAFDHFTLSESPLDNVRWLLDQLPADAQLDVDVVCHSRGGLLGRVLAENYRDMFDLSRITVRRVVFVATPNSGTPLADTNHMRALIDTYTFLFTCLPDNPVTDGIDAVLEVVKDIAAAADDGLAGLQAMRPGGEFLTELNDTTSATTTRYFGIAANYEPDDDGVKLWAADRIIDAAFTDFANDLVVPTDGVFHANGAQFPQTDRHTFTTDSGTHHCNFFGQQEVSRRLLDWLTPL
jgi:hypothetical protein